MQDTKQKKKNNSDYESERIKKVRKKIKERKNGGKIKKDEWRKDKKKCRGRRSHVKNYREVSRKLWITAGPGKTKA